jgi:hypothetical protein
MDREKFSYIDILAHGGTRLSPTGREVEEETAIAHCYARPNRDREQKEMTAVETSAAEVPATNATAELSWLLRGTREGD